MIYHAIYTASEHRWENAATPLSGPAVATNLHQNIRGGASSLFLEHFSNRTPKMQY